jgi:ubiquinone/menaquinone biosynthesis C-methylase UbiE
MAASEAEETLRRHPGVREAVVVSRNLGDGQEKLVAYVVLKPEYVGQTLALPEEERKRLQKWSKTFDFSQLTKEAASAPLGGNIAGWNSSYTRQPIPAEEMRDWIDHTVQNILALGPSKVLEIGCGSGLILLRVAPRCARYVGVDFSATSLQRVREQLAQMPEGLPSVELVQGSADNLAGLASASFDTIVVNSVIQYFPSASYLTKVLEKLITLLRPGGRIFVGDVLSLPLLEAYSASVELFQAADNVDLAELSQRMRRRIRQQPHLVISPAFFLALRHRCSRLSGVRVFLKRGRFDNELTRFRFDVVLSTDEPVQHGVEPAWQEWPSGVGAMDVVRGELRRSDFEIRAYRNVPNLRVLADVVAAKQILQGGTGFTKSLQLSRSETEETGIHPEALCAVAEELGLHIELSWASSREDGSFDAVFRRRFSDVPIAWTEPSLLTDDLSRYTNIPNQPALCSKLVQQLSEFAQKTLLADSLPETFVLLSEIPTKSDGELDRDALPLPEFTAV